MARPHPVVDATPLSSDVLALRTVPYDVEVVRRIKELPRRRWGAQAKHWEVPHDETTVRLLRERFGSAFRMAERGVVQRLIEELGQRDYSRATVRNYTAAAGRFLAHLGREPSSGDRDAVASYLRDLRAEVRLSARTVNLHAAAIQFVYRQVLHLPEVVATVPRMKTGRVLPKVYSQQEVSRILSATANRKHRLILMLAYGCGLRLGEIRRLRPEDIDLDRGWLTVRRGKGAKDRVVMVDESLAGPLREHLRQGRGERYLFEGWEKGQPVSAGTVSKVYDGACKRAGVTRRDQRFSFRRVHIHE